MPPQLIGPMYAFLKVVCTSRTLQQLNRYFITRHYATNAFLYNIMSLYAYFVTNVNVCLLPSYCAKIILGITVV